MTMSAAAIPRHAPSLHWNAAGSTSGRAVHAVRPPPAHRIGPVGPAVEPVAVVGAGRRAAHGRHVVAIPLPGQPVGLGGAVADEDDLHPVRLRRPDGKAGPAVGERSRAAIEHAHQVGDTSVRESSVAAGQQHDAERREAERNEADWFCQATASARTSVTFPKPPPPYLGSSLERSTRSDPRPGAPQR